LKTSRFIGRRRSRRGDAESGEAGAGEQRERAEGGAGSDGSGDTGAPELTAEKREGGEREQMGERDETGDGAEFAETEQEKTQGLIEHRSDGPCGDEPGERGGNGRGAVAEPRGENEREGEGSGGDGGAGGGGEYERQAQRAAHPRVVAACGGVGIGGPKRAEEERVALLGDAEEALEDSERGTRAVAAETGEGEGREGLEGGAGEIGRGKREAGAPEAVHFVAGRDGRSGPGEAASEMERGGEARRELAGAEERDDGDGVGVGRAGPRDGGEEREDIGGGGPTGVKPAELNGGGEARAGGEWHTNAGGERDEQAGERRIEGEAAGVGGGGESADPPSERAGDDEPRGAEEQEEARAGDVGLAGRGEVAPGPGFADILLEGHRDAEVGELGEGDAGDGGHDPAEGVGAEALKEQRDEGELAEAGDEAGENLGARVLPDELPAAPAGARGVGGVRREIHGRGDAAGRVTKYKAAAGIGLLPCFPHLFPRLAPLDGSPPATFCHTPGFQRRVFSLAHFSTPALFRRDSAHGSTACQRRPYGEQPVALAPCLRRP
jgi:hypothetical protein